VFFFFFVVGAFSFVAFCRSLKIELGRVEERDGGRRGRGGSDRFLRTNEEGA